DGQALRDAGEQAGESVRVLVHGGTAVGWSAGLQPLDSTRPQAPRPGWLTKMAWTGAFGSGIAAASSVRCAQVCSTRFAPEHLLEPFDAPVAAAYATVQVQTLPGAPRGPANARLGAPPPRA